MAPTKLFPSTMLLLSAMDFGPAGVRAFVTPKPFYQRSKDRQEAIGLQLNGVNGPFNEHYFGGSVQSPSSLLQTLGDVPTCLVSQSTGFDEESMAFTDEINFLDGPILTMLGIFGVVVVGLVVFKALAGQMDSAIEQVLVDFEATMKQSYPQRWQNDIRPQLDGLAGEARQQKLVQLMEEIQTTDPEFMGRVQQKMRKE